MGKKFILIVSVLAPIGLFLSLSVPACSHSQMPCVIDADCQPDEFCGSDDKCHKKGIPDGQDGDGNGNGDPDGDQPGDADQGPPPCEHDRECPEGEVCSAGDCVAGTACNYDYNCEPISEYYCHPEGKVCKKRSALCDPCSEHYECPDPGMGDMCIDYSDGKYCGMRCGVQACPLGYDCDLNAGSGNPPNPGQCRCIGGICGNCFVCHQDSDCASNKVCDRSTGKCVPKCTQGTCAAGKKCHYTGHCGSPCALDSDCNLYGDDLVCCTAIGVPSQYCDEDSIGKCRPAGCVLHSECLQTQGDSLGYCDKRTHECMPGCRAANPNTVNDCKSGKKCVCNNGEVSCDGFDCCPDPGESGTCVCDPEKEDCSQVNVCQNGTCEQIPCHERGDVAIACSRNQVCCGWPLADGYPCPGGVDTGECYVAPKDDWCMQCGSSGNTCEVAGYGYGEPGICMEDSGGKYCHLACRDTQDCPATWDCDYAYGQGCDPQQGANCEAGASCEVAYRGYDDQGSVVEAKACVCQTDADCPDDINGFTVDCVPQTLCDYTVEPADCRQANICMYARTCQCTNCCEELHSGG